MPFQSENSLLLTAPHSLAKKMRLPIFAVLAAAAAADWVRVDTWCDPFHCSSETAKWYASNEEFWVNANEGCRDPMHPNLSSLCMDWKNSRGHFYFKGQNKRCLRKEADYGFNWGSNCDGITTKCSRSEWRETACTW